MRKVVLYQLLSLDGVAEEPGDWLFDVDAAFVDNLGRVIQEQDAVLLGRGTYDYWVDYWPTAVDEPFASFINGTAKHVFTSTPPVQEWAKSTFVAAQPPSTSLTSSNRPAQTSASTQASPWPSPCCAPIWSTSCDRTSTGTLLLAYRAEQ